MAVEVIRRKTTPRKEWEFALEFFRGDTPVVHQFKAYPAMDAGGLSYTLSATRHPERAIEGIMRSVRKMLADDDGTPLSYRPLPYEQPLPAPVQDDADSDMPEGWQDAARAGWDENPVARAQTLLTQRELGDSDSDSDDEQLYTGLHGEPANAADVAELTKFENGSSLRRFAFLMDESDELTLDIEQLQRAYKKLLAQAADRPTRR